MFDVNEREKDLKMSHESSGGAFIGRERVV